MRGEGLASVHEHACVSVIYVYVGEGRAGGGDGVYIVGACMNTV